MLRDNIMETTGGNIYSLEFSIMHAFEITIENFYAFIIACADKRKAFSVFALVKETWQGFLI